MAEIKATAKWQGRFRITVDNARVHNVVCDLPSTSGGEDAGPTALELAVMSLAGCAATIFLDVCKKSKIELNNLEVIAEAEKKSGSPRLTAVNLKALISGNARKQLIEAAWRRTEARCPVLIIYQEPMQVKSELIIK